MRWIEERKGAAITRVMMLEAHAPLLPAFVELWKRVLAEGIAGSRSGWATLAIEVCVRQIAEEDPGWVHAVFNDARHRPCAGMAQYCVRSPSFDLIQGDDEPNSAYNVRQTHCLVAHYKLLKQAARRREVAGLLQDIGRTRPLVVRAATASGWFDFEVAKDTFGPLPPEDQAHLTGGKPARANPLAHLMPPAPLDLTAELNAALVAYTPEKFKVICCEIRTGHVGGQPALFYRIGCPQYPDEGTDEANKRVHDAAVALFRSMQRQGMDVSGVAIKLEMQRDGRWKTDLKVLSGAAA